ncbi:MAG TPA: Fur family transcriptional regulator [Anaerolineaceae bacterium]|nr:Fur family transcriptional regulator [Anaerolineaceae bacterium]HQH86532.1 Fur family transcriptional regulator [Anaerolineaceae bacterium]HQN44497.1 Fur family transcriptional regulator [Anaerolineaceae bacterium]
MNQNLLTSLQKSGLRLTATRVAICTLLAETTSHPTAAQIYDQLKPQYPSLSLATVYNTLDVLVNMGVINVLGHSGDGNVHFEPNTSPHINLACVRCHKIQDLPADDLSRMEARVSTESGYRLLGARVMYYGICPECQAEH